MKKCVSKKDWVTAENSHSHFSFIQSIYSDYLLADHSEPLHQAQPGPFNDIIGDRIFDDDHSYPNNFRFKGLIPILEEDEDDYDLNAAFCH
jgi:hypothetical protein